MPVLPASKEVEARGLRVQSQPRKRPYLKNKRVETWLK
jgi:hypothetical protein